MTKQNGLLPRRLRPHHFGRQRVRVITSPYSQRMNINPRQFTNQSRRVTFIPLNKRIQRPRGQHIGIWLLRRPLSRHRVWDARVIPLLLRRVLRVNNMTVGVKDKQVINNGYTPILAVPDHVKIGFSVGGSLILIVRGQRH